MGWEEVSLLLAVKQSIPNLFGFCACDKLVLFTPSAIGVRDWFVAPSDRQKKTTQLAHTKISFIPFFFRLFTCETSYQTAQQAKKNVRRRKYFKFNRITFCRGKLF